MKQDETDVDWSHWTRFDLWTLDQALCLLLRIDPDSEHAKAILSMKEVGRLHDLAWASYRAHTLDMRMVDVDEAVLSPQAWLAWAVGKNLSIPDELKTLLPTVEKKASSSKSPTENLEPGERTTLHKLGAYLARRFGYNASTAKNDATGKIRQELQRHGIGIDDKTIRKLLKTSLERFPDDRQKP